ncbi:MAG: pyridoxal-5'-phosphate-dependent protein [Alphaproteobacteria bacterium]|nr:pyridoxal-5'-phosphate-dependent protein [Alphaproteobacteria bacterium]
MTDLAVPGVADIEAAAQRLSAEAIYTPLIENPTLNELTGGRVLLKAETLQRTGSFKFRGAFNFISSIPADARASGVVTYSSGNHAQGVAAAAGIFDIPATIVMPTDAPRAKIDNTQGYGAEIVSYDRNTEIREDIAAEISKRTGATLVPPYDHSWTICGQGTVGLEIAAQTEALGIQPDLMLVCCGGGGLSAGVAIALADRLPGTKIKTVEPVGFDDTRRSLETGARVANDAGASSICDALLAPTPGEITFEIIRNLGVTGVAVDDAAVRRAVAFAWRSLKLVIEPGGAVALAAVLEGLADVRNRTVVVVLSGANVDADMFRDCLEGA